MDLRLLLNFIERPFLRCLFWVGVVRLALKKVGEKRLLGVAPSIFFHFYYPLSIFAYFVRFYEK